MVFSAFVINMLFIPAITQAIFGGSGVAGQMQGTVAKLAVYAGI